MKYSENWLKEWVQIKSSLPELSHTLTMAGLEVESILPANQPFSNVFIGEVLATEKHPNAERLNKCEVKIGDKIYHIICGAKNVRPGLRVAAALDGAVLPGDKKITNTTIRGEASQGMLCSTSELGLTADSDGIVELPLDAPNGMPVWDYFQLADHIIDVSITPNRGDCLSVRGLAREIAALTSETLELPSVKKMTEKHLTTIPVQLVAHTDCPLYLGRIISNIKPQQTSPLWLSERLRRAGVRSIHPVVDCVNYVMLEYGQPMHAFDLTRLDSRGIQIRHSVAGEKIELLDDSNVTLDDETLVIADSNGPLAIAGIMGGKASAVQATTTDLFLESAFFQPQIVTKKRQAYLLQSDSAYRYERGVDPALAAVALERVTQLIVEIVGGDVGPVIEKKSALDLPAAEKTIFLPAILISDVLGFTIEPNAILNIFKRLHFTCIEIVGGWQVTVPSYRFDISIPEDLVEEVARIYGYDKLPTADFTASLFTHQVDLSNIDLSLRQTLKHAGYHEIISYSFISKAAQADIDAEITPIPLLNPMTQEMAVMRTSLLPGLLGAIYFNQSRQQQNLRLFEIGTCFLPQGETKRIAGIITGLNAKEQWGEKAQPVDFFTLKATVENLGQYFMGNDQLVFVVESHAAFHPTQSAAIYRKTVDGQKRIGMLGALHPQMLNSSGPGNQEMTVYAFEIDFDAFATPQAFRFREISKFPEVRRDLALLVDQGIPAAKIQDTIQVAAGANLRETFIFDLYQGTGIPIGKKSIAIGLIWQHSEKTLLESEISASLEQIVKKLKEQLGVELRS